ncbi:MAG: hypothetical protein ACREC5_05400, partial [Thermoplasmata archaeon]
VGSDEAAAVLAGGSRAPGRESQFKSLASAIAAGGPRSDAERAALHLMLLSEDPTSRVPKVLALGRHLKDHLPMPLLASAVLVGRHDLTPEELADWIAKATQIAKARRLAPSPPELAAIGVALVNGLGTGRFYRPGVPTPKGDDSEPAAQGVLSLLALHAGVYRRILEPAVAA